ncbi:hypothetical protein [Candidatus Pristimantibacillus sp. PTI5]|uniref:hypothetical protein n=1 Tax=Candidatus Pristimantibacillus sp. PTI5 TaxID=3400422 RepID=UPI003B0152B9
MKFGLWVCGLILLLTFVSGCTGNSDNNSENTSAAKGTVVFKEVENENGEFRFLMIPNSAGIDYEQMSKDELLVIARGQDDSAWYYLSEEHYNQIKVGNDVEVKWDSSHQAESNPPLRSVVDIIIMTN